MDRSHRMACAARRKRFWFWRHEFSRGDGRAHSRTAQRKRQTVDRRICDSAPVEKDVTMHTGSVPPPVSSESFRKAPLRGALVIGAASEAALTERLRAILKLPRLGKHRSWVPPRSRICARLSAWPLTMPTQPIWLQSRCRAKAVEANQAAFWKAVRAQGIFRGHGPAPKVAFLYTGQGSQYANMLQP